ncbi:MAG: radical SAM protein [Planctomycetes bacterium]|nr:radical SAM protein [Planctomycetota bacterium]
MKVSDLIFFKFGSKTGALVKQTGYLYSISDELYERMLTNTHLNFEPFLQEYSFLKEAGYIPAGETESEMFNSSITSLSLTLMHGCNMACVYCCVGPKGSYNREFSKMTPEIAIKAVDFLLKQTTSRMLTIGFFGGEPLLNWPTIKETLNYTSGITDKKFLYSLATNGTMINDEIAETLARFKVLTYIPIDGPRQIHDKQRPFIGGQSTYDIIVKNLELLKKHGAHFHLKGVYTEDSPLSYHELRSHLEGIADGYASVSVAYEQNNLQSNKEHKLRYLKSHVNNALYDKEILLGRQNGKIRGDLNVVVSYILLGLTNYPNMCGAGWQHLQISPNGEFYVCHIAEAADKFKIGSIFEGFNGSYEKIKADFLRPLKTCSTCWAYALCMKECNIYRASSLEKNPLFDVDPNYCDASQTIIKNAIDIALSLDQTVFDRMIELFEHDSQIALTRAFAFREEMNRHLKHIKPCFLLPLDSRRLPIELSTATV